MRVLAWCLVLVLGLLCAAGGAVIWQQRSELEALRAAVPAMGPGPSAQHARLAERAAASGAVRDAAVATATAGPTAGNRATPVASTPEMARAAPVAPRAAPATEELEGWLASANDPEVMRRLALQARLQVARRYQPLFAQLGLPPAQLEAAIQLLAEKRQAPVDVAAAYLQRGEDPVDAPEEFYDMIQASRRDAEARLRTLLGEPAYARYQAFNQEFARGTVVELVGQALAGTPAPLSTQQAGQLRQVLDHRGVNRISAKVVDDSRAFLTPAQLQTLQDLRRLQQSNARRRNQPRQILPTAPPGN